VKKAFLAVVAPERSIPDSKPAADGLVIIGRLFFQKLAGQLRPAPCDRGLDAICAGLYGTRMVSGYVVLASPRSNDKVVSKRGIAASASALGHGDGGRASRPYAARARPVNCESRAKQREAWRTSPSP